MTIAILTLLGALIPIVWTLWRRKMDRDSDPMTINKRAYEQIDRDTISRSSNTSSAHSNDRLDRIDRLRRSEGDTSGPNGGKG